MITATIKNLFLIALMLFGTGTALADGDEAVLKPFVLGSKGAGT